MRPNSLDRRHMGEGMKYKPGSFTKNLGGDRNLHKGLRSCYFPGITLDSLTECLYESGIIAKDQALLVNRFFVATTVIRNEEIVLRDALVRESIEREEYDQVLARLYLFAVILNNLGERKKSIQSNPAGAQNHFVRNYLYVEDGWKADRLDVDKHLVPYLSKILAAKSTTVRKFATNLKYFFTQGGFKTKKGKLEVEPETWAPAAVKLFFERYEVQQGPMDTETLVEVAEDKELHKLLGVKHGWLHEWLEGAADAHVSGREGDFAILPVRDKKGTKSKKSKPVRESRQVEVFKRLASNRERLREWYAGQCQICGKKISGRKNETFDSAHIRPLNQGGTDDLGNMLALCPNHHRQLDLGSIGINPKTKEVIVKDKTAPKVLPKLRLHDDHEIDKASVKFQYVKFFKKTL